MENTTLFRIIGLVFMLAVIGYVLFTKDDRIRMNDQKQNISEIQDIYIRALASFEYDVTEITVKKGIPVRLHFTADPKVGCGMQIVIYGLDVSTISRQGKESVVEFVPEKEGVYEYSCGMRMMPPGKLIVTS
ncbi:MAG TPA: cupredoxin domain-containing protein [Candidatus Bilamarchaeaceae archaeon]|nr:cupredoxin domain-containing protein [Candidatus Bilamarchaeaceae archaeon]